jgi:hypothetical protein
MQAEPLPAADLPPDASSTILYAEVLLNIRTVTLFASLRTASTHDTKAHLSTDGSSITVSHEGESASIRLPIKAKGGGDAALNLPSNPSSKELSLRLQIEEQEGSDLFTGVHAEARKANIVSWDGASLNAMKGANIFCKNCQKNLVLGGEVKEWRDLPSENWAEMMDFWHCHKPDEHHLHDHTHNDAVSKKGYAAGTRLKAARGVGFVDLASLLLKEQDCYGVQVGLSFLFGALYYAVQFSVFNLKSGAKKAASAFHVVRSSILRTQEEWSPYTKAHTLSTLFRKVVRVVVLCVERPSVSLALPETLGGVGIKLGYISIL